MALQMKLNRISKLGLFGSLALAFCLPSFAYPTFKINNEHFISIACDTHAQSCLAIQAKPNHDKINHEVYRTDDAGETWQKKTALLGAPRPDPLGSPAADCMDASIYCLWLRGWAKISCDETATTCLIADDVFFNKASHVVTYRTENKGETWKKQELSVKGEIVDLECNSSAEQCQLLLRRKDTSVVVTTQDGGKTWTSATSLPNTPLSRIHCSESGIDCTLVGGHVRPLTYITKDAGLTWRESAVLKTFKHTSIDGFSDFKCDAANLNCIAVRYYEIAKPLYEVYAHVYRTENAGETWKDIGEIDPLHEIIDPFSAFSCDKSLNTCIAVNHFTAYVSSNGGIDWTPEHLSIGPDGIYILDLTCAHDGSLCQIAGFQGSRTENNNLAQILNEIPMRGAFKNLP